MVVIGEEKRFMYRSVFLFSNFDDFFVAVFVEQKFSKLCVVSNAKDVSDKNAKVDNRKHYDLRLRDPDDAEQLKRTCNGQMEREGASPRLWQMASSPSTLRSLHHRRRDR